MYLRLWLSLVIILKSSWQLIGGGIQRLRLSLEQMLRHRLSLTWVTDILDWLNIIIAKLQTLRMLLLVLLIEGCAGLLILLLLLTKVIKAEGWLRINSST